MAAIGIDLGNNFARAAVLRGQNVEQIIVDENGDTKMPCFVAYTSDDERLIGAAARDQALANPQNTFFNVKQVLGETSVSDVSAFNMNSNLPYMIDKSDKVLIKSVQGDNIRLFAPEEVIGAILHRIKTGAEKHLHARVTDAVISVPAAFNCVRRQAILDAAKMAGLNVMGLINEPTAALLGHGFPKRAGEGMKLLFHLGGGSFDVSVAKVTSNIYQVIATSGDRSASGEAVTERLMNFEKNWVPNIDFGKTSFQLMRLRWECEQTKINLARTEEKEIANCKKMCKEILEKLRINMEMVLKNARLEPKDIDEVLLIGDSTQIPFVKALIEQLFNDKIIKHVADDAVVRGCAVQAGIRTGAVKDFQVTDVIGNPIGMRGITSLACLELIPKDCQLPYIYTHALFRSMEPDLKLHLFEFTLQRRYWIGSLNIKYPEELQLFKSYKLKVAVNANGILEFSASTDLDDGEELQFQVIESFFGTMNETDIAGAAIEIQRRHEHEENIRRCRIAKEKFRTIIHTWNAPFLCEKNKDEFALEVLCKLKAEFDWLEAANEYDANVVEQRLGELKLFCKTFLEKAMTQIPAWVKNLYDIKKREVAEFKN